MEKNIALFKTPVRRRTASMRGSAERTAACGVARPMTAEAVKEVKRAELADAVAARMAGDATVA